MTRSIQQSLAQGKREPAPGFFRVTNLFKGKAHAAYEERFSVEADQFPIVI